MKKLLLYCAAFCGSLCYGQTIGLEPFASDFTNPTEIVNAGDSRLFVVEQGGLIRVVSSQGTINNTPFLDLSNIISNGGERGLLGLAFHPDYANNGFFYVNYTNSSGDTEIARYNVSNADADIADPASGVIMLNVDQPFANHNGGCIRFGPDGYLYISMGDGGSGGDPNNNAQNNNSLLGKMLRVDVDSNSPYGIPEDNVFADSAGADEIWSNGLRNAWKFSFNGNDVWIADVGQNAVEEINKVDVSQSAYYNFGWRCFEGTEVYNSNGCNVGETYTAPVAQYTHAATNGCSVTGGYVYNGSQYAALQGMYLFADYCSNKIGMLNENFEITWSDAFSGNNFSTFGQDVDGELYVAGKTSGTVYRIVDTDNNSTDTFAGSAFSIYPNPATDEVIIRNTSGIVPVGATVHDLSGKKLLSHTFAGSDYFVKVSNLPSGLYMMQITGANGAVYNHKLSVK